MSGWVYCEMAVGEVEVGESVVVVWDKSTSFLTDPWWTAGTLPACWRCRVHHEDVSTDTCQQHDILPGASAFYWWHVWIVSAVVDLWLRWPASTDAWADCGIGSFWVLQSSQSSTWETAFWQVITVDDEFCARQHANHGLAICICIASVSVCHTGVLCLNGWTCFFIKLFTTC